MCVPEDRRVSRGSRGHPQGLRADASACAARRPLRKPRTKGFGSQSRSPRCCRLSSSSLAAAGPGSLWRQGPVLAPRARRGFIELSGSPRRAGMLPQEDGLSIEKPRRRQPPSAIGQRGRRAGAPGSQPPALAGRRREPGASRALGGARRRGRVAPGPPHRAPPDLRGAPGCRTRCEWAAGRGGGKRGGRRTRSRGVVPELLAPPKKPSSFHTGSLGEGKAL